MPSIDFVLLLKFWQEQESGGILRNLGQLQEVLSHVKNSCEHGQKQEFSDRLQKWVPVKKSSKKKPKES